jgi:4'-phosphopantetheinyl transferase
MLVGIMDVAPMFEDTALFEKCMESVSADRRERAEHYKDYRDKCRCVGAGVLLNVMLGKYLGEEKLCEADADGKIFSKKSETVNDNHLTEHGLKLNDTDNLMICKIHEALTLVNPALNWNVRYSEKGKPEFLQDEIMKFVNCSNIHFNISHSANYVACAIADAPVGIDIEGRRKVNSAVAKRYFTAEEIAGLHSDEDFFKIWTFKEAFGKCTGEGLMPVIGKSEKDVQDEVSVNHYVYGDFQICVVTRKR